MQKQFSYYQPKLEKEATYNKVPSFSAFNANELQPSALVNPNTKK
jgi:hypothetical protein